MQKNVGGFDRTARIVVGPLLLAAAVAAFTGYLAVGTVAAAGALVAGFLLLATGTAQRCPVHVATGMNTYEN